MAIATICSNILKSCFKMVQINILVHTIKHVKRRVMLFIFLEHFSFIKFNECLGTCVIKMNLYLQACTNGKMPRAPTQWWCTHVKVTLYGLKRPRETIWKVTAQNTDIRLSADTCSMNESKAHSLSQNRQFL